MSREAEGVGRTPFRLEPRAGDTIRGDLWLPGERPPVEDAAIVVCHGFKGFKDWGFFPYLCGRIADETACPTVGFNFSGSGIGDDLEEFGDLDAFARNTFSKELADLEAVLTALENGRLGDLRTARAERFGLFGHSRGGVAAILGADRHTDVRAVVTWAAVSSVFGYEEVFGPEIESRGVAYVLNARTGQQLPIGPDFLHDLRANRERLDVEAAASRLRVPLLVIHGSEDETVPVSSARALTRAAGQESRLEIIEGAGHTMNASHPFPGPNPHLETAVELSVAHFRRYVAEAR